MCDTVKVYFNNWAIDNKIWTADHADSLANIKHCPMLSFPRGACAMIETVMQDIKGKKVLVPSSGDHLVSFAFCIMGADVTSTDFAIEQLKNAKKIAIDNNWDITFVEIDSIDLCGLHDDEYDFVFTPCSVHKYISNQKEMHTSFYRVLKPGGSYVFFENHPTCDILYFDGKKYSIRQSFKSSDEHEAAHFHWTNENYIESLITVAGIQVICAV
jgi:ubiquinone/menaquinone biosynthesis C-methylase UbiE